MKPSRTAQFTLALALSLTVHGAVYVLWPARPDTVPLASGQSLKVSLLVSQHTVEPATEGNSQPQAVVVAKPRQIDTQQPAAAAPARQAEITQAVVSNTVAQRSRDAEILPPSSEKLEAQPGQTISQQQVASSLPGKPVTTTVSADSRKHIQQYLHDEFQRYFYYPRLAIKRGWQGEVQIGLRIEANGTLSRIRVLRGSGYNLLDNAATKSLARVEVLPAAVSLLGGSSLDVILPVEYRLL